MMGEMVYEEPEQTMLPGIHSVTLSPDHLSPGMYYAMLRSEEGMSVVKMVKQ
jgi:hypothetical protein